VRSWIEALGLAAEVGKGAADIKQCDGCGNYYVSAVCDNIGRCYQAPQMPDISRRQSLFDPMTNMRAALQKQGS
jgi:hypothetical protein